MGEAKFRNEFKYVITDAQSAQINAVLRSTMRPDPYADEQHKYIVRSLYFDDFNNTCFYSNLNGIEPREKFRIRTYNINKQKIQLEIKQKVHGKTRKHACSITEEQCHSLMKGQILPPDNSYPDVLQKLLLAMKTRLLRPTIIVQFARYPYVKENTDLRITLDTHLTSSTCISSFFELTVPSRSVLPVGKQLMEIKFDHFIPSDIYRALSIGNLQRSAFSKYSLCRNYSLRGVL